ncbi:MAG: glycosyltransferase family 87 protein [Limisphaerales bacterium]
MMGTLSQPTANNTSPKAQSARWACLAGVLLWLIPAIVISIMSGTRPEVRTVSGSYHLATAQWWAGKDIYVGPSGMNYFPHFVVLYTPFHLLPLAVGEVLWRLLAIGTIATGVWKLIRILLPENPDKAFLLATLLAMPLSLGAVRNGNSNAVFGGVLLWATIAILDERWWAAALLTILSMMIKPLGIVLFLLAPLHYSKMRVPLAVGFLAMLVFPFFFGNPTYVWSQHKGLVANLQSCAVVTQHRFADINGIFRTFKVELAPQASKIVRVVAGAVTAALWWWGSRRLTKTLAALWLLALTTSYLMLFNPMTEANSYSIVAPALAAWACIFIFGTSELKIPAYGWLIAGMALTMGLLPNLVRPMFGNYFALIWHPLMMFAFIIVLLRFVAMSPKPQTT